MLLGLGRGPPGRGPPGLARSPGPPEPGRPAGRGPPGRGPPGAAVPGAAAPGPAWPAGATGRGVAPMPVAVELNGLLPGRGPGRGACRWPGAAGRGPAAAGRGVAGREPGSPPGLCVSGCVGMVSAGGTCGPTLWSCGNGTVIAGPERAGAGSAGGMTGAGGSAIAAPAAGPSCVTSAGAAGAVPFAAAPLAAASAAPAAAATRPLAARRPAAAAFGAAPSDDLPTWPANASLSRRTTGASIVEDADRTNSPISWSLAITALLSTPNSFASS